MAKQSAGKMFEADFANSVTEDIYLQRLRDMGGKMKYRRVKYICDFIAYRYPNLFLLELKSHKGKSLPFSALQPHQVGGLYKASKLRGIKAGFLFNFRDHARTYYVPADKVRAFIMADERKSFPLDWCEKNGIKVDQQKIKTRYRYDISKLFDML